MKVYLILLAMMFPLGAFAIGKGEVRPLTTDTLILVPINQGREIVILEGENISLDLTDGSKLIGVLQEVNENYLIIDRQRVFFNEIDKIGLKPQKRKRSKLIYTVLGLGLAYWAIVSIRDGEISLFDRPSGSGILGELAGLLLWLVGLVVLGVTLIVVLAFLLILLASALGLSAAKKRKGKYDIGKNYNIKTGIAK